MNTQSTQHTTHLDNNTKVITYTRMNDNTFFDGQRKYTEDEMFNIVLKSNNFVEYSAEYVVVGERLSACGGYPVPIFTTSKLHVTVRV